LFVEEDLQDEPVVAPLTPVQHLGASLRHAMAPLAEMAALLRDEHRARRLESRQARVTTA
jgi:hypothetical protein